MTQHADNNIINQSNDRIKNHPYTRKTHCKPRLLPAFLNSSLFGFSCFAPSWLALSASMLFSPHAFAALPMLEEASTKAQMAQPSDISHSEKIELTVQRLANHPSWLRLLHYPEKAIQSEIKSPTNTQSAQNIHSRVGNASFFVSQQGAHNPKAEIRAMLNALMSKDDVKQADASVQCRFPARTAWLQQQLNLELPNANCPSYDAWFNTHKPKQLAVIFAQEYPDSMNSAFAHTLLRIDTSSNPQRNNYKDSYALNYTLEGDKSDNAAKFAIKSMTGKYPSLMTVEPYQPKLDAYLSKDQRDVWTYPMNLTTAETQQIVRHVWEVKDLSLPYYFFTSNCASEILRLVDVVRPNSHLYDEVTKFAIPSEVVRLLDDASLLNSEEYIPAVASINQAKRNSKASLSEIKSNPYNFADNSPVDGFNVQKTTLAVGKSGKHDFIEFGVRASYRDLLDPTSGYRQNLDMDGLQLKLRRYSDHGAANSIQLQELTLLRGRSYHPNNTARAGTNWGLDLSAKQVKDASVDYHHANDEDSLLQQHLVGNFTYEKGFSKAFGTVKNIHELPSQLCYAFGTGSLQAGKGLTNNVRVGVGATLGCAYQFHSQNEDSPLHNRLRSTFELKLPYWYHGKTSQHNRSDGYWQPIANLGVQYDIKHNHAIRLQAEHEFNERIGDNTDLQLSWQHYF